MKKSRLGVSGNDSVILNKEAQEEAVSSFSFRQLNMMSCFLLFKLS